MGEIIRMLTARTEPCQQQQRATFYTFIGGPLHGQTRLMGYNMTTIVLPGCCPIRPATPWQDEKIFVAHAPDCECPEDFKGMQEYRVNGLNAFYVGRRPNPETEDEDEPVLWTP